MDSKHAFLVFDQSIKDYHKTDFIDQEINNPFDKGSIEQLFYHKNWIDTVQWHLEDIIRDPKINPEEALVLKRRIDASNQVRTDMVEYIDSYFLETYKEVTVQLNAKINTESPAWAFDRLSILALKIHHMDEEANRLDATPSHKQACQQKLNVLLEQKADLTTAIDDLLADIKQGIKYMKVYKQMKMYNDDDLNPILRARK